MAEGRRGGDAGVNTPVISVKCTWAQLARRYYCSYAEALRAGNKWREISRFLFFFFFFLESLEMNGQGMDTKGAIIGRDCFGVGFGNARVKNGFLKGDENVISFFFPLL